MSRAARNANATVDDSDNDPDRLYCICQTPYVQGQFMIQCDGCNEWYHGTCVGISPEKADMMTQKGQPYYCDACLKSGKVARRRGGQFLEGTSPSQAQQGRQTQDIRTEAVKHMKNYLDKAIALCRKVISYQIANHTTALSEGQEGTPIDDAQVEQLRQNDQKLEALAGEETKLHEMAQTIENAIFNEKGSEHDKPYRYQYRGLKSKLDDPKEHQFRLDIFLEARTPESLSTEDVSAYKDKSKH